MAREGSDAPASLPTGRPRCLARSARDPAEVPPAGAVDRPRDRSWRPSPAASTSTARPASALEVVGKLLPLAPSTSHLPWAVENLRFCNWCDQPAQKDLNDCPTCGRRMAALPR